jgi:cell wall-associated NlpC family hydrolase
LRAVRTDPVSGLANIERGVKRIAKGVRKGSFSEIEGGKRAIVRGVVKATPGDLQRKKELQAKLERKAGGIAAGLAIVGFGLFSHNQLKRAPFYRDGVGRQIDDAVSAGINRVLDVTPGLRGARAERRAAGRSAAGAAVARATAEAARGPEAMRGAVLRTPTQLERRATEYGNAKVLENKIKALDIEAKELDMNASTWRQKNLETFWGATRTNAGGAGDGSTFSEPATNAYLSRQFGFKLKKGDDATTVRRSVATALNREARNLQALARQEGVNLKDANSRNAFLNRVVGPSTANFPNDVRERAVSNLDRIIGDAPRGGSTEVSRKQLADTLYRDTRAGFDKYFERIADEVRQPVGAALSAEARKAGYSDLLTSARIGQSRYLAKSLNKPEAVGNKMSQGLSDLVAKEYYSSKVIGSPTFTATDREIRLAASELSGRSFSTTAPAADYLRSNGFERLTTLRGSQTRVRASTPSPERPDRPARRRSNAQRIADLMRQKNKDGTPRYATREAAEAALKRMRKDELQQARIDAYLAVRADLASHIPKAHKCSKTQGRTVEQQKKRETVPQDREYKQLLEIEKDMDREAESKASNNPEPSNKINKKAVLAVIAAGATAATGAYVIQDLKKVAKDPNMFSATPSTRSVAKAAKKEFDTKKTGTAMGDYYTQKSGLKPGDVVYYRDKKDPAAHFGVYLGEGKDGKIRAVMANTNEKRAGFVDVVEIGTTKRDSNDAAHILFPVLQKAPPLKGAKARTNEETVRRALRAVGTDYKFSLTRDNCEVLANSIAYDTPRSQQLERFTRITRAVADNTVGTRQRVGMAVRRAQGQRKTAALTATQILQRLNRDDNTFITKEGRDLARAQYSQYFNNSAKLDAAAPLPSILVSPEELWKRIKDYDDDKKAVAMRDYLLVTRLALSAE